MPWSKDAEALLRLCTIGILDSDECRAASREFLKGWDCIGNQPEKILDALPPLNSAKVIDIKKDFSGFNVLILPRIQFITNDDFQKVIDFVDAGGCVISSVHTFLQHPNGKTMPGRVQQFLNIESKENLDRGERRMKDAKVLTQFGAGVTLKLKKTTLRVFPDEASEKEIAYFEAGSVKPEGIPAIYQVAIGKGKLFYLNFAAFRDVTPATMQLLGDLLGLVFELPKEEEVAEVEELEEDEAATDEELLSLVGELASGPADAKKKRRKKKRRGKGIPTVDTVTPYLQAPDKVIIQFKMAKASPELAPKDFAAQISLKLTKKKIGKDQTILLKPSQYAAAAVAGIGYNMTVKVTAKGRYALAVDTKNKAKVIVKGPKIVSFETPIENK